MARPKGILKDRATYTIDKKVVALLDKKIAKSQRSTFVESAIKAKLRIITDGEYHQELDDNPNKNIDSKK